MLSMSEQMIDLVSTGWLRLLPEPAFNAYLQLWRMAAEDEPVAGDPDEVGADALDVAAFGGLDAPYDPAAHGDADDVEQTWARRWTAFAEQAAARGLPMHTPRHAIEFMRVIGLVEREERDGEIYWQPVVPVPLAEDVLHLDEEERERQAGMRWHHAFQRANYRITAWLVDQRSEAPATEVVLTLAELAGRTELDVDEARHGLAGAMAEAGDITVTPHPEVAEPDQPLKIVVDWSRFDAERIAISFGPPDAD